MSKFLLKDNRIYYLVFTTFKKIPIFSSQILSSLLIDYIYFYYAKYQFEIFCYSIMPCHLNLLARFKKGQDIEDFEHDIKSYATNQFLYFINNLENIDYQYICGTHCYCQKFAMQKVNPGASGPGVNCPPSFIPPHSVPAPNKFLSAPSTEARGYRHYNVSAGPPCPVRDNKLAQDNRTHPLTQESLNIIKNKKRVWRHKSWKQIIDNQEQFKQIYKYIYYNNKKHNLIIPNKRYCHKDISDL